MANDLAVPSIADAQADGQWQTSNDADAALGNALADILSVDFSGGDVTLTATEFRSAMMFTPSGLAANQALTIPAVKRGLFLVHNSDATWSITVTKGSSTVVVAPGEIGIFKTDGTTNSLDGAVVEASTGSVTHPMPVALSYGGGPPEADEVLTGVVATSDIDFPADFANSAGYIGTNPTGSFVISVKDDGTEIGTITIGTDGSFTFATTSNTAKTVAAGSRIEFVAPASADATAAYILATLKGTA